jgi:hypothetical protein
MGERTVASLIINKWDAFNIGAGWQHFGGAVNFANGTNVEFYHPQEYNLNEWYHVAMISNAAEEKVYFYVHDKNYNEIFKNVKSFPAGSNGQIVQNENLLTIGGLGGGSNLELDGYLDELRITKEAVDYSSMVVGINNIQKQPDDLDFTISPNPITNESEISFQTKSTGNVTLSVFDLQGRKITTLLDENRNAGKQTVPIKNTIPASGIYFCKLVTRDGISVLKFVVK